MFVPEPRFTALVSVQLLDAQGEVVDHRQRTYPNLSDLQIDEIVGACAKRWFESGYRIQIGATPSPADPPGTQPLPWATATTDPDRPDTYSPSSLAVRGRVWIERDAAAAAAEPPTFAADGEAGEGVS